MATSETAKMCQENFRFERCITDTDLVLQAY